MQVKSNM